jgi:hypothetical protein
MNDYLLVHEGKSYNTPKVRFIVAEQSCTIEGESLVEDAFEFYYHLVQKVNEYFLGDADLLTFHIKLTFFNTSSSKGILELLQTFKYWQRNGKTVIVNWYYPDPDHDYLLISAQEFMKVAELEMNLKPYQVQ